MDAVDCGSNRCGQLDPVVVIMINGQMAKLRPRLMLALNVSKQLREIHPHQSQKVFFSAGRQRSWSCRSEGGAPNCSNRTLWILKFVGYWYCQIWLFFYVFLRTLDFIRLEAMPATGSPSRKKPLPEYAAVETRCNIVQWCIRYPYQ